jgi:hypothetical protein
MSFDGPGHIMPGNQARDSARAATTPPRSTADGLVCGDCGRPFDWTGKFKGQCSAAHRWREPQNGGKDD